MEIKDYILIAIVAVCNVATFIAQIKGKRKITPLDLIEGVKTTVVDAVEKAEQFKHWSAAEKKAYAMTELRLQQLNNGTMPDDAQNDVDIERLIEFSKRVNPRDDEVTK